MYLHTQSEGTPARDHATEKRPIGPGLTPEQALRVHRLEIWATSMNDPGPDRCEFRCFDSMGKLIHSVSVGGY